MEKIAIIGISSLFPEAENINEYWQNLLEEKDVTSELTSEEIGVDPSIFYDPKKGAPDKYYCMRGGYIRDFKFDYTGYNISPESLEKMDRLYLWALYTAKEALIDSGYIDNKTALDKCGVILGNLSFPTKISHNLFAPIYTKVLNKEIRKLLGNDSFSLPLLSSSKDVSYLNHMISGYPSALIAQALSLSGGHFSLDAACASSLYAVKLGCDYLLSGKTDIMLVGAISCADPFFINMGFSIFQAYPENNSAAPLDKNSKGLFASEGAGMAVLKRYNDAIRDGDKIYAVILGRGLSNDGRGTFVLKPNPKGEILALERAYKEAETDPKSIEYIECHATGTPTGDMAELNSMEAFFGKYDAAPLIGSVKSNLGHLLTAAGMASLIKVVLSMKNEKIPATINIKDALTSKNKRFGAKQAVKSAVSWSKNNEPKRAGINTFGFGGANAHIILESPPINRHAEINTISQNKGIKKRIRRMAIIGMEAFFGSCRGLEEFDKTIYEGRRHFIPLPRNRWQGIETYSDLLKDYGFKDGKPPLGAYIDSFPIDFLRFKLPPNKEERLIPQHLLILKAADMAILNAGLNKGGNTAVIIGMEAEQSLHQYRGRCDLSWQIKQGLDKANISLSEDERAKLEDITKESLHPSVSLNGYTSFVGNIMASRIASLWDFSGPVFTVSACENSAFKALELAEMLLNSGEVDAAVVGAVDLSCGFENLLLRNRINSVDYDEQNEIFVGEGAGAVVLKTSERAEKDKNRIYALIDAISFIQENRGDFINALPKAVSIDDVAKACIKAFKEADIAADNIGYLEVFGSGVKKADEVEIEGIASAYGESLKCRIGNVKANIGNTYAASGIACLIKTALSLYNKYIPASPEWQKSKYSELEKNGFYAADKTIPWVLEDNNVKRIAAINGLGTDGSCSHIILSENINGKESLPNKIEPLEKASLIQEIILGGKRIPKFFSKKSENNMLKIIRFQINAFSPTNSNKKRDKENKKIVWDEAELLEFGEGKISNVFGSEYEIIDSYKRRVRLPMPPYLLVTRVTRLYAEKGSFKPSAITTEYDVPYNAWYSTDGQVPVCVAIESGQCDLLLISFLGIDFENKGKHIYRLLDCTLTFLDDLPEEGNTLQYDIKINSFVRNGENLLFFFSYECFVHDKMILKMDGGCAGFFSDEQLEKGKGVVFTEEEIKEKKEAEKLIFEPLLICQKSEFDKTDITHVSEGNIAACFGEHYFQENLNPSLRLPPKAISMIDKITSVDFMGGAWGLGLITAEKKLEPNDWYFPCHFKDDEVLAGSLMSEGCYQLLEFYMLYLGLHTCVKDARFQPIPNLAQNVRCRGQITPISDKMIYKLEVTEIGLNPQPYIKGNVEIIFQDKIIVYFKRLGLRLSEKNSENSVMNKGDDLEIRGRISSKKALLNEEQIAEFCLGSVSKCFGPEFAVYDEENIKSSRIPNTHLNFISRALEVEGECHKFNKGAYIITEYDAPKHAWYYRQNSSIDIPYSIIMEMGLQPCGLLSAYLGSVFLVPGESLFFRNLDGNGIIEKDIDIRGKVLTNKARLLSSTNISGIIIQKFDFDITCEKETFYKGEAAFGYFTPEALSNQVGLDGGKDVSPWYKLDEAKDYPKISIELRDEEARKKFYRIKDEKPYYRLAEHQLNLLHNAVIVENGGKFKKGYIYAEKTVYPNDWYFKCHFYRDPVMPGSLGIEAILQAMRLYALHKDLGGRFKSPCFCQAINNKSIWKYRGQIPHGKNKMYLEVDISEIKNYDNGVLIIGDASLWKPGMRIYEVKDAAIYLKEYEE